MIFLKGLLFIVLNVALGAWLIYITKWFLFNPRQRSFFGVKNPLTPGFLVRKREWLFYKAKDLLHGYIEQAGNSALKDGYLFKLEEQVQQTIWEKTSFIDGWKLLPEKLKKQLHNLLASLARDISSRILRKLVPHFIEQLRLEYRIDQFDEKLSMEFVYKYFRKFVYIPLLLVVVGLNFLLGIFDMILFFILV